MRFVELNLIGKRPVLINVDKIISLAKDGDHTQLNLVDGIVHVVESPDEIILKIRG